MNGKYYVFSINTFNSIISSKVKISVEEPKSHPTIISEGLIAASTGLRQPQLMTSVGKMSRAQK